MGTQNQRWLTSRNPRFTWMPVKLRRKLIVIVSFGSGLREAIPAKNRKILPTFAASSSAFSFSMALLALQVVGDGGFFEGCHVVAIYELQLANSMGLYKLYILSMG